LEPAHAGHIFISYRSLEPELPLRLAADLRNAGVRIWLDRLDGGIRPGEDWRRSLEKAVDSCAAMIAVLSPEYVSSEYCRNEMARANTRGVSIFPIVLREVACPIEVQRTQFVDFRRWMDEAVYATRFEALLDALRKSAEQQIGEPPDPERRYLTTLISQLEAKRAVSHYVDLAGEIDEVAGERVRPSPSLVDTWGLDGEYQLLEQPDKGAAAVGALKAAPVPLGSLRDAAERYPKFVLLGKPGTGKTTTLRRLALDAARVRLEHPRTAPLPILVELPRWSHEPTPLDFVQSFCPFDVDLAGALRTGAVTLYLDGLNEMGEKGSERAGWLRDWIHSAAGPQRVILTCRSDDYAALDLKLPIVWVNTLGGERIKQFAASYLEGEAEAFLGLLKRLDQPSLSQLSSNAYLLTILIVVFKKSGAQELPRNNGVLFRSLATLLWDRERRRRTSGWVSYEQMEAGFARLAYAMIENNKPSDVPRDFALRYIDNPELLKASTSASLLEERDGSVRFQHQLLQESFAGVQLLKAGLDGRAGSPRFVGPNAFNSMATIRREAGAWDQAIIAACGLADDPDEIVARVAAENCYLALECIESGVTVSGPTLMAILNELVSDIERAEASIASIETAYQEHPETYASARGLDEKEAWIYGRQQLIDQARAHIRTVGAAVVPQIVEELERSDGEKSQFLRKALVLIGAS
jgi:hypothetical protein